MTPPSSVTARSIPTVDFNIFENNMYFSNYLLCICIITKDLINLGNQYLPSIKYLVALCTICIIHNNCTSNSAGLMGPIIESITLHIVLILTTNHYDEAGV